MRSEKKAVWLRIFSKSLLRTQSPDAVWSTPSKRLNLGCALDNKLLRFYCVNHTKVFSHLMLQIVHYWSDIISTSLVPALLHFHFKERLRSLCSVLYRCHGLELLMQNSNAHGVKPIATKALWPRRETFAWFSFFFLIRLERHFAVLFLTFSFFFLLHLNKLWQTWEMKETRLNWQMCTHWKFSWLVDVLIGRTYSCFLS